MVYKYAVSSDEKLLAHLYRRAGFGATPEELERGVKLGFDAAVDELVAGLHEKDHAGDAVRVPHLTTLPELQVPGYQYNNYQEFIDLTTWWIERMIVTDTPLREKLTLLLHEQFPTSIDKVNWPFMMYTQNELFRNLGPGNFETLVQAVSIDPAMLIWLDAGTDVRRAPNQNFARELMERFTMGVGNYSEQDVIESARAFTGWELDDVSGEFFFNPYNHDYGVKRYLGHKGKFFGKDIIHIATHEKACSTWVTSRLWSWLSYPVSQHSSEIRGLAEAFAKNLDVGKLVEGILRHPAFKSDTAMNGLIKQPVEYVIGTLRLLGLRTPAFNEGDLQWQLSQLGQTLFAPPSVGGWGENGYWLSTVASNNQLGFAWNVSGYADLSVVADLNGNPGRQVAAVGKLLNIDSWSSQTYRALMKMARSGGGPNALVVLGLTSPDFVLN